MKPARKKSMAIAVGLTLTAGVATGSWPGLRKNTGPTQAASHDSSVRERAPSAVPAATTARSQKTGQGELARFGELAAFIERHGLAKKAQIVAAAVPSTPIGKVLGNAILLDGFRPMVGSEEAKAFNAQILALEADPQEAVEAIAYTLDRLPAELSQERRQMISFVASLPISEERKMELFSAELKRPVPQTGDPDKDQLAFATVAALEAVIDLNAENHPEKIEQTLQDALAVHKDNKEFQSLLLFTYASVDPQRSAAIGENLELR